MELKNEPPFLKKKKTFLGEHTDIYLPIAGPKANTSAKCTTGNISALLSTSGQGTDQQVDRPQEDSTLGVPTGLLQFGFCGWFVY